MMGFSDSLWYWRGPVLFGVLLLAAPAQAQNGSPLASASDPAFDRYLDVNLLATAWGEKNAEMLADLGLQLLEGERVLLRPHKAITAEQVLSMAAKIAAERKDTATLTRLAKALQGSKSGELATQVNVALKLASISRAPDPSIVVRADQVSPGVFLAFQATLEEIHSAKIARDRKALDRVIERVPELKQLSDSQRRSLLKAAGEAQAALPADTMDVDPAIAVLNKLAMESRNPPRPRRPPNRPPQPASRPPQQTYHPQPAYHPPQPAYHPPQQVYHPPQPVYHPPQTTYHPPPSVAGNNMYKRNQNKPYIQNKTKVNVTVINNITNIYCTNTFSGFVIGGNTQCAFTSNCTLDPGDVIVSIGGVSCSNSNLSLQDLIALAYQNGNLIVVVRDVNTGNLDDVQLDSPDGTGGGNDGNGGGDN